MFAVICIYFLQNFTIPDDEIVSLMVARPSLSIIARKLQHEAATLGMTAAEHDALMASLKDDL
ncbi:hypothetical protein [Microcystis sp. LEGE 08355]|uniref:hypothetical protein n=1 Tax=Microcystis sp. LEGE 08355 TaxID=1828687 RepID=UPI001D141A8A|nr:hypothetical protein [Microcystis sp. LEGE 08355]